MNRLCLKLDHVNEDNDVKKDGDQIIVQQAACCPVIFYLSGITGSLSMLIYLCDLIMSWWIVTDFVGDYLERAGERYREDGVSGYGSGFFGCFVGQFITWNVTLAWNPLNVNGGRNGINGFMHERGTGSQ